jgi:hypothetical protein
MNTDLPAPAEHFRLTRARELRRKADRLKRRLAPLCRGLLAGWTLAQTFWIWFVAEVTKFRWSGLLSSCFGARAHRQ